MNVACGLEHFARVQPDWACVHFGETTIAYGRLNAFADAAADELEAHGVGRGDRVALLMQNRPEFFYYYYGVRKLGAVVVALNPSLTLPEDQGQLADCTPKVVVHSGLAPEMLKMSRDFGIRLISTDLDTACGTDRIRATYRRRVALAMEHDALAVIAYTSGTTGVPKGVMLSHGNIWSNVEAKPAFGSHAGRPAALLPAALSLLRTERHHECGHP